MPISEETYSGYKMNHRQNVMFRPIVKEESTVRRQIWVDKESGVVGKKNHVGKPADPAQ